MITVKQKIHFTRGAAGRKQITEVPDEVSVELPVGRIPRVSKLMALAIRFDRLLQEREVENLSDIARLARVTQPRITQIMNLLHLAPDIQEEILFLPRVTKGRPPIDERKLRHVTAEIDWRRQRELWRAMRPVTPSLA